MTFPIDRDPYIVFVSAVTDGGSPVSGTQFKLTNLTKNTYTLAMSNEADSNISINLSNCGDWDIGDNIKIMASYYGKIGSSTHQVTSSDNGYHDFGTITLSDASISGIMRNPSMSGGMS